MPIFIDDAKLNKHSSFQSAFFVKVLIYWLYVQHKASNLTTLSLFWLKIIKILK